MSPRITSTPCFLEETGVGKFYLINFLARWQIAQVSPDSGARNLDAKEYQSQLGPTILRLWDTVCPIILFLFYMRENRVTVTTAQNNYALFHGVLGKKGDPIAFASLNVEKESVMVEWWSRSVKMLDKNDIVSAGHACITTLEGRQEYQQSAESKRAYIINTQSAFHPSTCPPRHSWYIALGNADDPVPVWKQGSGWVDGQDVSQMDRTLSTRDSLVASLACTAHIMCASPGGVHQKSSIWICRSMLRGPVAGVSERFGPFVVVIRHQESEHLNPTIRVMHGYHTMASGMNERGP
ncbi:hypothetical protein PAXINDRAFT_102390 [Paxillus involutus ATCC 200175]|uniref:Uncharacterized protein n=1 Tax=Paxillus involutus ATCC 200175 TaxID=664439 RepID=A0A0C9TMH7_PAXIN|nr:hypothetical protein PAXINDRAFT_102390 [Paxillus involutus ATCC 200175]